MEVNHSPRLFNAVIPDNIVLEFFMAIGLSSLSDTRWVSISELTNRTIERVRDLRQILLPYVHNHKRYILTRNFDGPYMCIRLIRQIAKAKGYTVQSRECKDRNWTTIKRKTSMYRLISNAPLAAPESFIVRFD